jgi:hypothetical protein
MDHEWSELVARIVHAGQVSDGDVMAVRDEIWADDEITRPMVDGLFLINDACTPESRAWADCFIEAIEHFLLHQRPPFGFIDEPGSAWLMARIDHKGTIGSATELELIVDIVESAENAPERLKDYAIAQVEKIIVSGEGATRRGPIRRNCVDEAEVSLLRRLIFAGGGEGAVVVGSKEADMLFRIKNATLGSDNAPGWTELFVQGVGNHLLAHSDYRPLSTEEAIRLNKEMDINVPNVSNFLRRMIPGSMFGRGTLVEAFKAVFPNDGQTSQDHPSVGTSPLTPEEAGWLKENIVRDGQTDDLEKALMTFIIDEVGNLPPQLEGLRVRA